MRKYLIAALAAGIVGVASAQMRVTEWSYSSAAGEFIEFTNVGGSPIDMTGWSFDDDSRLTGTINLSGFGIVAAGQSVILTEIDAATFASNWGLTGVPVIGGNAANLARNDEINLYDATTTLIDRLTFGDQNFAGSIRTQNAGGNPSAPAALGTNDVYQWQLSFAGDGFGSRLSSLGDLGNPGAYVPEPSSLALLAIGSLLASRRR